MKTKINNSFSLLRIKFFLLFLIVACGMYAVKAQSFENYFKSSRYEKDPSAEAVVISDVGKSWFNLTEYDGFEIIFQRTTQIKIYTKAGLKWGEFSIPFYKEGGKNELIWELKGKTYNEVNGNMVESELQPKNVFEEKISDNLFVKKFAMPDVKEGSVIVVSYEIKSPYIFHFRSWEFQRRIPVIYSMYTTKMIPFYEYRYVLQGVDKFTEFNSFVEDGTAGRLPTGNGTIAYKNMVYEFIMKDVPAFKDESYITSINDYIIKMDFQLNIVHHTDGRNEQVVRSWSQLTDELTEDNDFGKYLKNSSKRCREIAEELGLKSKPAMEKAKIIDRYIKSNFNWNGRNSIFSARNIKDFTSGKIGNSADINLFYVGMLNAAGIQANPVILSTRSNGKIKTDYPFLSAFNYVIAEALIDGNILLLDATEPFSRFSEIPSRCLNDRGYVVQKNKSEWVDLKSNSVSGTEYNFELALDAANDNVIENCRLISKGYDAIRYRNEFQSSASELKNKIFGADAFLTDSLKCSNLSEIDKPFEILFQFKNPSEKVEDKIIISPFGKSTMTENPLKQPVRNYPVDMIYRNENKYQSKIKIPEGYKLVGQPESLSIDNDVVRISYNAEITEGQTITITGIYEFKKDLYPKENYADIKGYFNKIVDKFNEKLVLVKTI